MAEGDLAAARRAYEDSLEIRKRLAEANPSHAGRQIDLVVSRFKLAQLGGHDARGHLEAALEILRALHQQGRLEPRRHGWIGIIEAELAVTDP